MPVAITVAAMGITLSVLRLLQSTFGRLVVALIDYVSDGVVAM